MTTPHADTQRLPVGHHVLRAIPNVRAIHFAPQPDCRNRTIVVSGSGSNIFCNPQTMLRAGFTST